MSRHSLSKLASQFSFQTLADVSLCLILLDQLLARETSQFTFQTLPDIGLLVLEYPLANLTSQFSLQKLACVSLLVCSIARLANPFLLFVFQTLPDASFCIYWLVLPEHYLSKLASQFSF